MRVFFKYWLPVLLWAGLIYFVSSLPGGVIPSVFFGQDILFHFFEYIALAIVLYRALTNSGFSVRWHRKKQLYLVIVYCLAYAISDELHQRFVPERFFSIIDLFVDSLGVVLGSVLYPAFAEDHGHGRR